MMIHDRDPIIEPKTPTNTNHLVSPFIDFWLIGGASLFVWVLMFFGEKLRMSTWAVDHHYIEIPGFFSLLFLFANYPHFMASYRLAYTQGQRFIIKNWIQLVLVPILLGVVILGAYRLFIFPIQWLEFIPTLNLFFENLGWQTRLGQNSGIGTEFLSYLLDAMYFTVGWHYCKQTYGCMMVYAHYDCYPLEKIQRQVLRWNLLLFWLWTFFLGRLQGGEREFFGLKYRTWSLPSWLETLSLFLLGLSFLFVFTLVFWKTYLQNKKLPSVHFLTPFISMYVWWTPLFYQKEYYNLAVPFFHSLQYLAFVYRVETAKLREKPKAEWVLWKTFIPLGLILAGFIAFEWLPVFLDNTLRTEMEKGFFFFFICAHIFINIHHYFIDNVLWRLHEPSSKLKRYLFSH